MVKPTEAGWNFDNGYARLPNVFFTEMKPNPVEAPEWVVKNEELARTLGLEVENIRVEELAGNEVPEGGLLLAQAYAGHQFGHFNMLGDGRAMLLGEQITPSGKRVDIQLKGSGRTPYSRGGDGRAGLGPMLREYIISEAMYGLGIPTTRSLAVVTTGQLVFRQTVQQGAILTRVASSHLRVGTFQYAVNWGGVEQLQTLADYTLDRHFPGAEQTENRYLFLLEEVIKRQANLISKWQLVGFIHGVMNTDNMALSGETIDYGPCAFINTYDLDTVFSSIDVQGRYAYGNQPRMAGWNLARLAEALLPLLDDDQEKAVKIAQEAVLKFPDLYREKWLAGMREKLGLFRAQANDKEFVEELLSMMQKHKADYTNTFRALTLNKLEDTVLHEKEEFNAWYEAWQARLNQQEQSREDAHELMKRSNPAIIPRNHRVEEALEAAEEGDLSVMKQLVTVLSNPYAYTSEQEAYTTPPDPSSCANYQTFCGT
ncbi:YdiU family protein [Bacillus sp. CGMCC 1.16541]|uniref:protein adenylyltransferase SelO n=1 Tax=Bacillus sp. CGMCC 1.16541 TaxID=2185143 RepID=UPI000D725A9A|nr:YdiU family protein [Bacillus sp. CGMCC 1.16541]